MGVSTSWNPDWPAPNYINPVTRPWLPAFALTWQILSTILIAMRFWLRAMRQADSFGIDDVFATLGWVLPIGLTTGSWIDAERYGTDRPTWDVKGTHGRSELHCGWIAQICFILSTTCTKLSALLFYRRMIKDMIDQRWLFSLWAALAVTAGYGISMTCAYIFTCIPVQEFWKFPATCHTHMNASALAIAPGILGVCADLMAVALPCLVLRKYDVGISARQKMAWRAIFASGSLATGAGIARACYLCESTHTEDASWTTFNMFICSIVECQLAIICASAPLMRAFFRRYLKPEMRNTLDKVRQYGGRSKENTQHLMGMSTIRTQRDDRSTFWDLKESESGVHGTCTSTPVIVCGGTNDQASSRWEREDLSSRKFALTLANADEITVFR